MIFQRPYIAEHQEESKKTRLKLAQEEFERSQGKYAVLGLSLPMSKSSSVPGTTAHSLHKDKSPSPKQRHKQYTPNMKRFVYADNTVTPTKRRNGSVKRAESDDTFLDSRREAGDSRHQGARYLNPQPSHQFIHPSYYNPGPSYPNPRSAHHNPHPSHHNPSSTYDPPQSPQQLTQTSSHTPPSPYHVPPSPQQNPPSFYQSSPFPDLRPIFSQQISTSPHQTPQSERQGPFSINPTSSLAYEDPNTLYHNPVLRQQNTSVLRQNFQPSQQDPMAPYGRFPTNQEDFQLGKFPTKKEDFT